MEPLRRHRPSDGHPSPNGAHECLSPSSSAALRSGIGRSADGAELPYVSKPQGEPLRIYQSPCSFHLKAGEAVRNDKKEMRLEQSISWSQVLPTVVTLGPASPLRPERLTLKMPSFHSKVYSPRIRADSLVLQPISQSQAEMRKQVLGSSSSGSSTDREPSAGVLAAGDTGALTPLSLVSSREAFLSVL